MSGSLARPALILGLLSCIGPFAIDMYLPAMPVIGQTLGTTPMGMQSTITAYFAAFGVAQMLYGPWADQSGRKLPLYAGIGMFVLGTILCMTAGSATGLIAGRFVQGLGGAALGVVPRAIVRDMMTGAEATRMMSKIMLTFSVSPMLAPLAGSALLVITGWRGIFAALLVASVASLLLLAFAQPETLAPENRRPFRMSFLLKGCAALLVDKGFMLLTCIGAFGFGSFFIFLAAASYVYQQGFGLSSTGFSLAFAANAISFIGASQGASGLAVRFGNMRVLTWASAGFALATCGLFALALAGMVGLWTCIVGLALGNACMGLIIPSTMVMALDDQGDKAGLASSLGGTLQMLIGGVMVVALGPWLGADALPMIAGIAFAALVTLILTLLAAAPQPRAPMNGRT
jgi:DHA1 family bicyclomycin/chloramphenicol resistance-like MFS transporter